MNFFYRCAADVGYFDPESENPDEKHLQLHLSDDCEATILVSLLINII